MTLRVLLLQLPVPNNPATNVPLAAGYLTAYAHARGLLNRVQIEILPRALADHAGDAALVDAIVARRPDVLGLSLYTWNSERTLDVARRARERLPEMLVVAGGPEVQRDNEWVLRHPGLDIGVIGEGEQTFAELLELVALRRAEGKGTPVATDAPPQTPPNPVQRVASHSEWGDHAALGGIAGLALRGPDGRLVFTGERTPLPELSAVPSPYLLGLLEIDPGAMLMVEVSRWCPYACSFCLYGRNTGPKLGGRSFGLERLLAEIRWGMERGATRVHFIEANLNLVPVFRPLMQALADLNADGRLALYAELRGEHLTDEAVAALTRAGLRVAEVGLQTANPAALRATRRRTDLQKWAAGTRRLYGAGVEVLLDVILGLPADDAAGVAETLDFIDRERLGPYDAFTLQALPGVAVRQQAEEYGLVFQDRPPYYVLATDRLPYERLRALRRSLKAGAGHDPDAVEGCPEPHERIADWQLPGSPQVVERHGLIERLCLGAPGEADAALGPDAARRLATHVSVSTSWEALRHATSALGAAVEANPSTLLDIYLLCEAPPPPRELQAWRDALPFRPGYLDRVAVYRRERPEPPWERLSPRLYLVLPWSAQVDPAGYAGVAEVVWEYHVADGEEPPFGAWRAAGGAGVWVRGASLDRLAAWRDASGVRLWHAERGP